MHWPQIVLFRYSAKIVAFCLAVASIAIGEGCQPYARRVEIRSLDSLAGVLGATSAMLSYDEETLKTRLDTIAAKVQHLDRPPFNRDAEAVSTATKLLGIDANYRAYLAAYPALVYDQQVLAAQLNELINQVADEQKLSPDTRAALEKLKESVAEHQKTTLKFVQNLTAVEMDYDRQRKRANELLSR